MYVKLYMGPGKVDAQDRNRGSLRIEVQMYVKFYFGPGQVDAQDRNRGSL